MNWAKILLEMADKDLEAAKCLYDKELYPQSIFYLQQSVEKATKSFGLVIGIVDENELMNNIGHNPLKIHKRLIYIHTKSLEKINEGIEKAPKFKEFPLIKTTNLNKTSQETNESLNFFDDLVREKNVSSHSKEEIGGWIKELNKLKAEVEELNGDLTTRSISNEEFNRVKQSILKLFDALYEYNPQKIEKMRKELDNAITIDLVEEMIRVILSLKDAAYVLLSLLYLSIITRPLFKMGNFFEVIER